MTDPLVPGIHPSLTLSEYVWRASGTSDPERQRDRWTEVTITKLSGPPAYVVYGAGRTEFTDEVDRFWMFFCPTAPDLIKALLRPRRDGGKHLPNYAADALRRAAELDENVQHALTEWDRAAEWAR